MMGNKENLKMWWICSSEAEIAIEFISAAVLVLKLALSSVFSVRFTKSA